MNKKRIALFLETSREAGRAILRGVARYTNLKGNWQFYHRPPFYYAKALKGENIISRLKQWGVDGIITREPGEVDSLIRNGTPTVIAITFSDDYPRVPQLVTDAEQIAKTAFEHFEERGFKHFGYCGYDDMIWSRDRGAYYAKIARRKNHDVYIYRDPPTRKDMLWEDEKAYLIDWLSSLPRPIAIFCCNDDRGSEVIHACKEANLRIPYDAAVLGVDDDDLVCSLCSPKLSSIGLDFENAGWEAGKLLDRALKGEKAVGQQVLATPTKITTRHSTDILALEDKVLIEALRCIRSNTSKPLGVDDVARTTGVARRTIEYKFRNELGFSVREYIHRVRVQRICQMLTETNLTISDIAARMGFDDAKNLSRYFKKQKGVIPMQYRKDKGFFSS